MSAIDRVRIIVLGDSGVGKTSFVHLAAHGEPLKSPSWTVGCSVEVKLHEYKEGTPEQTTYFIEFWDIGGSNNHRNARHVFYNPCHGIILAHDLTNRKSQQHLNNWLHEVLNRDANKNSSLDEWDTENFVGAMQIPILVIGTKLDQEDKRISTSSSSFASRVGADEILLDCRQVRYLAAGTSNAVKLTRFYDKVIEKKVQTGSLSPFTDRYMNNVISPTLPSKYYAPSHLD